jgi:hypothetical protein
MPVALHLHPESRCDAVRSIDVFVSRTGKTLNLRYLLRGSIADLQIPALAPARRANQLWEHSCCELFVKDNDAPGYSEFNFSPSTEWAAYRFASYRQDMRDAEVAAPQIATLRTEALLELHAIVIAEPPTQTLEIALSVVIEERNGRKSYWALKHPSDRPDFHHADSFALSLSQESSL